MAERMVEVVGWKDPIGEGLYNMGVTDERIIRCRDCKNFTPNEEFWIEPPKVPFPIIGATVNSCDFWAGTKCKVDQDGFFSYGIQREKQA